MGVQPRRGTSATIAHLLFRATGMIIHKFNVKTILAIFCFHERTTYVCSGVISAGCPHRGFADSAVENALSSACEDTKFAAAPRQFPDKVLRLGY